MILESTENQLCLEMLTMHPVDPHIRCFLHSFSSRHPFIVFGVTLIPSESKFKCSDGVLGECQIRVENERKKILFTFIMSNHRGDADVHNVDFNFVTQEATYRWAKRHRNSPDLTDMTPVSGFALCGHFCGVDFLNSRHIVPVSEEKPEVIVVE